MKIPRYWAKHSMDLPDSKEGPPCISCWGWSESSREEALANARQRAARTAERLAQDNFSGAYDYSDRQLREEILKELADESGQVNALVTRNGYGSAVLNTESAMFVDVDLPRPGARAAFMWKLKSIFNSGLPSPSRQIEQAALDKLDQYAREDPDARILVYRTLAGFRYLIAHRTASPTSAETLALMERLGADPLYVKLCKVQECFRARLTPKPWRCGAGKPKSRYPRQSDAAQRAFKKWLSQYDKVSAQYATCKRVKEFGNGRIHRDLRPIVKLHDKICRVESFLPLA